MARMYCALFLLINAATSAAQAPADLGPFTALSDVGDLSRKSIVSYDRSSGIFFLSAAGDNIWDERDAFGFVWKEMKGDASIGARVRFMGKSGQPHRKAGVMLRQSVAADSLYVDAVVHGNGLTSLQYRTENGGPTREIQCAEEAPTALRLEKRGDYIQLLAANEDGVFFATGCQIKLALGARFLAGLAVCAHDDRAFENARFSSVSVGLPPERRNVRISAIETVPLDSLDRRILWYSSGRLEVPSFTARGDAICFREDGQLKLLSLTRRAEPKLVGADNLADCATAPPPVSRGQNVVSRAERNRSQIWLEPADGKPRRVAGDKGNQWSPRLAPDALSFAYLSSAARTTDGKPPEGDYLLMQASLADGGSRALAHFHGGTGSLGIAPWSADGKRIVFVSREPEPRGD
jgi:TolB protein